MPEDAATPEEQDAAPGDAAPEADLAEVPAVAVEAGAGDAGASATGPAPGIPTELTQAVGAGAERLIPFARQAGDLLTVALEGVVSLTAGVQDLSVSLTDYQTLEREFGERDHIAFELRVAISDTDAHLMAVLVPLEDVGTLFTIDTSAEPMADAEFARAQIETVSAGVRELLDLISLTLFAGGLAGAEVTLSDARRGQIEMTMGMLADVAQGVAPARVDFALALPDESLAPVVLAVPVTLLSRIAGLLGDGEASAADAGQPATAAFEAPGFALGDDAANVTPLHTGDSDGVPVAGSVAGAADEGEGLAEVPVHPVRFPPLDEASSAGGDRRALDVLMDVSMRVSVELGRSTMLVEEILALAPGSVVELNKLAGEAVDILVNARLIARGEVVVVDENFGVRVTELVSPRNRAETAGR